ncbi:MAG: putative signal transducing protein [Bacteroidota bacterium]|jgi:ArsR family metal-binding transcriptional regulator
MNNENDLLVVATYNDALEAGLAQDRLRENDIISFLEEENILGLNPDGGVEIKVRRKDFIEAKEILEEVMK